MMLNLFFKELYFKILLLLTSFSFITGDRFEYFDKFFYFDIFMIIYVLSSLFVKKVLISTFTFNFIKILFIILLPSIILINFTNNILDSLQFLSQYLFLILMLPLFLESIYLTNKYNFFLKILLFFLIINSILFLLKSFEIVGELYFSENYGTRFVTGEFTPNDMGHYLVLMLFLITLFGSYRFKIFIEFFTIIPYILTLSKTVWVQIIVYFVVKKTKIVLIGFVMIWVVLYFTNYLSVAYEIMIFIIQDFSTSTDSNKIRIEMMDSAINSIPSSILYPGYHSIDNLNTSLSVHNGILSYIVNFGLISFVMLILAISFFIFKNIQDKYFRFILFFILLDCITLLFNPIMNSRVVWLPLFIYIYTYHYKKVENV